MKSPQSESRRKRRKSYHKRVSACFAELSKQEDGVQVGHMVALGVELRCPIHGLLEDTQKLRCDLFSARHGRFDCRTWKLCCSSFELIQDIGCFHWRFRAATSLLFILLWPWTYRVPK